MIGVNTKNIKNIINGMVSISEFCNKEFKTIYDKININFNNQQMIKQYNSDYSKKFNSNQEKNCSEQIPNFDKNIESSINKIKND